MVNGMIHTMYYDNLEMLTLFRGGPTIWISPQDADKIKVEDNDWIEVYNRNGVVTGAGGCFCSDA